jgi:hypothetical protein
MVNVVCNRAGQCEAANDRTDSIRCVTKCLHKHVGHAILITALHPATCRQVVNALDSQKKQSSNDRRQWAVTLTEIKDRFENEGCGDDWDHVGHQEVAVRSALFIAGLCLSDLGRLVFSMSAASTVPPFFASSGDGLTLSLGIKSPGAVVPVTRPRFGLAASVAVFFLVVPFEERNASVPMPKMMIAPSTISMRGMFPPPEPRFLSSTNGRLVTDPGNPIVSVSGSAIGITFSAGSSICTFSGRAMVTS